MLVAVSRPQRETCTEIHVVVDPEPLGHLVDASVCRERTKFTNFNILTCFKKKSAQNALKQKNMKKLLEQRMAMILPRNDNAKMSSTVLDKL